MIKYKVQFLNKENNLDITIDCPDDKFLLEVAEEKKIELPYSCRAGSCSTCLAKIIEGSVDQSAQSFLDNEELLNGFILTCIAYPTSDLIISTHEEDNLY